MRPLTKYAGLILLLTAIGCAQNPNTADFEMSADEMMSPTETRSVEAEERKLIKEGHLEFETYDFNSTREIIFKSVEIHKGYVSSDQEYKHPGRRSNTVVVRIPAENFDGFLHDATQGVKEFDSKEIDVKDVTEEYLDIQARLKTKKELEARFLDLLKQAQNVTEILEIETQVGQLRSEIESIEGRLKYLQSKVSFSTLTMTFYESVPLETEFGQAFKRGFKNGWDNLIWFFVALANIWPFLLLGVGLVMGIKIYKSRK